MLLAPGWPKCQKTTGVNNWSKFFFKWLMNFKNLITLNGTQSTHSYQIGNFTNQILFNGPQPVSIHNSEGKDATALMLALQCHNPFTK